MTKYISGDTPAPFWHFKTASWFSAHKSTTTKMGMCCTNVFKTENSNVWSVHFEFLIFSSEFPSHRCVLLSSCLPGYPDIPTNPQHHLHPSPLPHRVWAEFVCSSPQLWHQSYLGDKTTIKKKKLCSFCISFPFQANFYLQALLFLSVQFPFLLWNTVRNTVSGQRCCGGLPLFLCLLNKTFNQPFHVVGPSKPKHRWAVRINQDLTGTTFLKVAVNFISDSTSVGSTAPSLVQNSNVTPNLDPNQDLLVRKVILKPSWGSGRHTSDLQGKGIFCFRKMQPQLSGLKQQKGRSYQSQVMGKAWALAPFDAKH